MDITKNEKKLPEENNNKILSQKPNYGKIALIISGAILVILIFSGGFIFGRYLAKLNLQVAKKEQRSKLGDNLRQGKMGRIKNRKGLLGEVIKIEDNKITIHTQRNEDKIIITDSQTKIKKQGQDIKISDIKEGDKIMVVGKPDDQGVITAKIIKIMGSKAEGQSIQRSKEQETSI